MGVSITIASIAGNNLSGHVSAMIRTLLAMPNADAELLLCAPTRWGQLPWVQIPDWGTDCRVYRREIGNFILHELPRHITTDFVIIVQADGYAVHPEAWTDDFLRYDYIGAPLPWWETLCIKGAWNRRVGSGGFCLRSKRFLEVSAGLPYDGSVGEDIYVSRIHHHYYEHHNCRFAPVPVALHWCYEHRLEDYPQWKLEHSFGQHGLSIAGAPLHTLSPVRAFWNAVLRKYRPRLTT